MLFDGPLDLVREARKANEELEARGGEPFHRVSVSWPERYATRWAEVEKFFDLPWQHPRYLIDAAVKAVRNSGMAEPQSIRRRNRMSEVDGDVVVERLLDGDPMCFRQAYRKRTYAPTQVSLLANLDLDKDSYCNPSGVFYRSAVAIAAADALEDAGYSVEVWNWCLGGHVFPDPNHWQFTALRCKEAGQPVDVDALCNAMSAWMTTDGIFGSFAACPVKPVSKGSTLQVPSTVRTLADTKDLWGWAKYLDLKDGIEPVVVPMVRGWGTLPAERAAKELMDDLLRRIEG